MLSREIERYVSLHRAMGFKFRTQESLLRNYARFAGAKGDRFISSARAIEWAAQAPSPPQRHNRIATLRRCALNLRAEDARNEVPPADIFGTQWFKRRKPHLYTAEQITQLLQVAGQLGPKNSIRPLTYATIFGLLAATGMRISEALQLRLADRTPDGLLIHATKFKKERLVPLHPSTERALDRYLRERLRISTSDPSFFIATSGRAVPYATVVTVFLSIARRVGLREGPGKRGPRLHDMRHTFAVRSLERCPTDRESVARHIVGLSTYLGHAHVSDTYWYLQANPTLLREIAFVGEALHGGELS